MVTPTPCIIQAAGVKRKFWCVDVYNRGVSTQSKILLE